jgi:hypothetical protein
VLPQDRYDGGSGEGAHDAARRCSVITFPPDATLA